jgi:hypothetical protein
MPQDVTHDSMVLSPEHIILSTLGVLYIVYVYRAQLKHLSIEYSLKILKKSSIAMVVLEILRVGWSTFYYGFSLKNLRFDWCNQICMTLPFIILSGKKKAYPYLDLLSFIGGAGVLIYPIWVFYDYAGLHLMSLQSMISHTLMIVVSISLPFTSDYWDKEIKIKKPLICFGVMAAVALIMSRVLNTNYLLMLNADGIPLMSRFEFPTYWLIGLPMLILVLNMTEHIFKSIRINIALRKNELENKYINSDFQKSAEDINAAQHTY